MVAVTTSTRSPIVATLTGIDQDTMTDVYVVLTDRTGNDRFYPFTSITADVDAIADMIAPSFTGTAPRAAEFVTDGTDHNDIQDLNITFAGIDEDGTLSWLVRAASEGDLADNAASIGIVKNATAQLNYGAGANADVAAGVTAVTTGSSPIEAELTNIDEDTMTDVYVVLTDRTGNDRFYRFLAVTAGTDNTATPTVSGVVNRNLGIGLPTPTVVRALGGGVDITLIFPDLSEDIVEYWWVVTTAS